MPVSIMLKMLPINANPCSTECRASCVANCSVLKGKFVCRIPPTLCSITGQPVSWAAS